MCMFEEKIDMKTVVLAEEYCKSWMEKWSQLYVRALATNAKLLGSKEEIGAFYLKLELTLEMNKRSSEEAASDSISAAKIMNYYNQAKESAHQIRADIMQPINL